MTHIPKELWFQNTFAEVLQDHDILRQPELQYQALDAKQQNSLRQTGVFTLEIVQVLANHESFTLIRKFEGTLGWMPSSALQPSFAKQFVPPLSQRLTPLEFFKSWLAVPYVWGGLSKKGIDCSGFTQLYYLHVHNLILPKNSRDQRKLGVEKTFEKISDHDLVFCFSHENPNTHHVAIYFAGDYWHARTKEGIFQESAASFVPRFKIEAIKSFGV